MSKIVILNDVFHFTCFLTMQSCLKRTPIPKVRLSFILKRAPLTSFLPFSIRERLTSPYRILNFRKIPFDAYKHFLVAEISVKEPTNKQLAKCTTTVRLGRCSWIENVLYWLLKSCSFVNQDDFAPTLISGQTKSIFTPNRSLHT